MRIILFSLFVGKKSLRNPGAVATLVGTSFEQSPLNGRATQSYFPTPRTSILKYFLSSEFCCFFVHRFYLSRIRGVSLLVYRSCLVQRRNPNHSYELRAWCSEHDLIVNAVKVSSEFRDVSDTLV